MLLEVLVSVRSSVSKSSVVPVLLNMFCVLSWLLVSGNVDNEATAGAARLQSELQTGEVL